jgi:hypothetical protein
MAVLAAAAISSAAGAQTVAAQGDAAERVQLAQELYELSGGAAAMKQQIHAMMDASSKAVTAAVPPDAARFTVALQRDTQEEVLKIVPQLMDAGVKAYADQLTTQQLRDYIAWLSSDSGKAVIAKAPAIRQEIADAILPLIVQMYPELRRKVSERVCEELKCTASERELIASAMARAFASPKS